MATAFDDQIGSDDLFLFTQKFDQEMEDELEKEFDEEVNKDVKSVSLFVKTKYFGH